jgi:class 3 adenylate cyclase
MSDVDPGEPGSDAARVMAERAGVERSLVEAMIEAGIVAPGANGTVSAGDVRRVHLVDGLAHGGIPSTLIVDAVRRGTLNIDFVDQPSYDRFSAYEAETFEDVSRRTGVPVDLLLVVREATGSPAAAATDRVRTTELGVVPYLEGALQGGVRPEALARTLRVAGDGVRRLAETEADWWRTDILGPLVQQGVPPDEIGERTASFATLIGPLIDDSVLALYHGHQAHAWMRNIFDGFEDALAAAGLYERLDRLPAIAFIDVTGYSRLTEERGDASAADLAGRLARLVQRVSAHHGGRTVKWLGDGLMVYYPDASGAVAAAIDLRDEMGPEHLPPAHVGIHAGPVVFQEGDYFGSTVNAAARIGAHAGAGQILASDVVVRAVTDDTVTFHAIGPVELKGLLEPISLYAARRATRL